MERAVGIDVSGEWVDVGFEAQATRIARTRAALLEHAQLLPHGCHVVVEATGKFHRVVVECFQLAGHQVKVVDPYAFSLYRQSMSPRLKSDVKDALVLARYAAREWEDLPECKPLSKELQLLKDLLEERQTKVNLRTSWTQLIKDRPKMAPSDKQVLLAMERDIEGIERRILKLAQDHPFYDIFIHMDGVGPATAPALVWLFAAHQFANSDQSVAYVGMDVRIRESGKWRGKAKLTKRGPAFIRRLLYCAANSLRHSGQFKAMFERLKQRGLGTRATNMIVGRRILRAAFFLTKNGIQYNREAFLKT